MKKTYNSKNLRKLKIISLGVGIASVTTAIAVVTPLVIQKNTSTISSSTNNPFFAKPLNTTTNSSFIQQSLTNSEQKLADASLSDFTFPQLNSANQTNITGANLQNLYNISGNSILYAQSKGSTNIDSIVSINQVNNDMNWSIDSASLISAINTFANSNSGQSVNSIFSFNKMVYSPATGSVFLNLYVGNSGSSSGYTTIVQISNISGSVPTISDYYNASTSNNTSILGSLKNDNFSQFVIEVDGSSPILYLIKDKYTQADRTTSASGNIEYNLVTFATSNNNITAGSIIRTPLSLSVNDVNFLDSNSSNALYVTNSNWTSGGGSGGLMVVLCRSSVSNLNQFATMYSFAATGTTFLNSPSSQILNLNLSQFNSNQAVILNLETIGSNFFLIGSQKNSNNGEFNSVGSIASFQISININGNNAPISLTTYSNNNFAYGNGHQILGIVNVNNTLNLPTGAQYIALTSSGALVILNNQFNYLNELATIPSSFFPSGVSVLHIIANGLNYLIYLSNGSIIVFNNTGYLGYLSNISTNNTVQAITPISFVPQNNVANGIAIFTQPLSQFITNVTSQTNQLIFSLINTTNTNINYLVKTQTVTNSNTTVPYSAQVTLNLYQQLYEVNANGVPIANSPIISTVFLGSCTYNIYNKTGAITSNPITSLPESLQNVLPSQITADQAEQYLLNITNIDQNDIFTNGANNVTVTLSPQDNSGTLVINVTIGSYWAITPSGVAQQQNTSLTFTINNFVVGPAANQLDYTLNPTSVSELKSKYGAVAPDTLTDKEVLTDFIKLSSYLAGLQGTTINIVPDDATGIATITITFNFPNSFFNLASNSAATLVTQNSITWNTPAVFSANPSLNDSILFSFNSSQEIASKFPQTINNLPSAIASIVDSMKSLTDQIQWLIDKGFINISTFVRSDISSVTVITGQSSNFTGSFSLLIELNNPLPNTTQKTYLYNYYGFLQQPGQVSSVFTVKNLSNQDYLSTFQTNKNFNSIFSVEPSLVTKQNILNSLYTPTDNPNQLTGYLIELNSLASSSQYTIDLTPDDSNGSLLITLVFSDYVEMNPTTNVVQTVKNKRFVFIYNGFVKSNNIQLFSLNWKSSSTLLTQNGKASLLTLSPEEAIKNISTGTTTTPTVAAINQLEVFADLSQAAINLYQNAQLIDLKLTSNDLDGTITVDVTFTNWNGVTSPQPFSQTFSGFLISQSVIETTFKSINPLVSNMEQILSKLKESIPSGISQQQWLSLFNFTTTILNSMQKRIYVLYNNETGYVSFVIYAKPDNVTSTSTAVNNSKTPVANNIEFILLQQTTPDSTTTPDKTTTPSSSDSGLNFSDIPTSALKSEGFFEVNTSGTLYNGFKQQHLVYTAPDNVLAIILGIVIPCVVLIPLILLLAISKNKKAIKNVKAKIAQRLEEEYAREKDLDKDEK